MSDGDRSVTTGSIRPGGVRFRGWNTGRERVLPRAEEQMVSRPPPSDDPPSL
jgi:hypothetical protein